MRIMDGKRWLVLTIAMAYSLVGSTRPAAAEMAVASITPCVAQFASPVVVPIGGALGGVVVDDVCKHVYVTNTTQNRVEVFSLEAMTLEAAIPVGSQPVGLDITPDGKTLYVANSGGSNISVVDLSTRVEVRRITVPSTFSNDTPFSIAIAGNGLALFSTTFAGSGFGGRLLQLTLATDQVSPRPDFWFSGSTTERTILAASKDRSTVGIVAGDISSGPVFTYHAATNTFSPEKDLNSFISDVGLSANGSTILVTPG